VPRRFIISLEFHLAERCLATIVAITGQKGGIGKTSMTAHLAGEFAAMDIPVWVLDSDPQHSLHHWASMGQGVLRGITRAVQTAQPEQFRREVEQACQQVGAEGIVLIDTPPGLADPALLAALLADVVLLPAGPSPLDIVSVRDAQELAREAKRERGGLKPQIFFVPSKLSRTSLSDDLPATLEALGEPLLPGVGQRTAVAESALVGLTLAEYARRSKARTEFKALAAALLECIR
jgi:chromosome partitioning protein